MPADPTFTRDDAAALLAQLGLPAAIRDFSPIAGGAANRSYALRSGGVPYILTLCDEKGTPEVLRLVALHAHLRAAGFPTPAYVAGSGTLTARGQPVTLRRFAHGEPPIQMNHAQLGQLGEVMASLHRIPPPADLPRRHACGPDAFQELAGHTGPFPQWLSAQTPRFRHLLRARLPTGLIHGDIFPDNLIFDGDNLRAVIDFEQACCCPLVLDLGMAAGGCCRRNAALDLACVQALIGGYERLRGLEDSERSLLRDFIACALTATAFWRYRQFNIRQPTPARADHWRELRDIAAATLTLDETAFTAQVFPAPPSHSDRRAHSSGSAKLSGSRASRVTDSTTSLCR